jgi:hypothetical protein
MPSSLLTFAAEKHPSVTVFAKTFAQAEQEAVAFPLKMPGHWACVVLVIARAVAGQMEKWR